MRRWQVVHDSSSGAVVSVILNSYNQGRFLPEAVESVLGQTYADLELIAVDNGSTDESPDILARYASDSRVRLFLHSDNAAITRRFNQAVEAARGEFVSFLYSDDYFLPAKLERQVERFRSLPMEYAVVYGPAFGLNQDTGQRWSYPSLGVSGDVFADLMLRWHRGQIDMSSPLTRRSALLEYPFDETIFAEGEAIFNHIALTYRFAYTSEPLVVLRDHGVNAGKAIKRNCAMSLDSIARLRSHPSVDGRRAKLIDRYEGSLLRAYGWQAARLAPDVSWARTCLLRAAHKSRREALHPKTLVGLVLTSLPPAGRATANRLGHRIKRAPGHAVYLDDFEGLGSTPPR